MTEILELRQYGCGMCVIFFVAGGKSFVRCPGAMRDMHTRTLPMRPILPHTALVLPMYIRYARNGPLSEHKSHFDDFRFHHSAPRFALVTGKTGLLTVLLCRFIHHCLQVQALQRQFLASDLSDGVQLGCVLSAHVKYS